MIFNEIYSCYYNAVSSILKLAVKGNLTYDKMKQIIDRKAFSESFLTIIPALKNEEWQLMNSSLHTPLKNEPTMPLTILQKRWLKAISLDPRIKLFRCDFSFLDDVKPLFTNEDYVIFDKYNDGDPYNNEDYIRVFHTILDAIKNKKKLKIYYISSKNNHRKFICSPYKIEYSEKDDVFRLLIQGCRFSDTLNIKRIKECEITDEEAIILEQGKENNSEFLIIEVIDERNALERVLLHFAHFKKEAERILDKKYKVKIYYNIKDETELVIRVLSFGPFIKVIEPIRFVNLIKERLLMQKSCGLK